MAIPRAPGLQNAQMNPECNSGRADAQERLFALRLRFRERRELQNAAMKPECISGRADAQEREFALRMRIWERLGPRTRR